MTLISYLPYRYYSCLILGDTFFSHLKYESLDSVISKLSELYDNFYLHEPLGVRASRATEGGGRREKAGNHCEYLFSVFDHIKSTFCSFKMETNQCLPTLWLFADAKITEYRSNMILLLPSEVGKKKKEKNRDSGGRESKGYVTISSRIISSVIQRN